VTDAETRVTVLYFADTRFPIERANGVQTIETCHALARRGHDVTLVVRPDNEDPPRDPFEFYGLPRIPNLRIHAVPGGTHRQARRVRFLLSALAMCTKRPEAVVLTRDLGLAATLLQVPKRRRPRVVYESHGHAGTVAREMPALLGMRHLAASPRKLARLDRRERRVWALASSYVTLTRALADEMTDRYGGRPHVFVVPDAARPSPPPPPPPNSEFVAAYAGHLYPWKGVDVFVQALAIAPGVHGLIVGGHPKEADLDRVRQLVRDLSLANRITITGLLPPGEVTQAMAPASVLVLPNPTSAISEHYTSPLKLFEYLHLGRPIVASNLKAIREVLADERTALLVPPGDVESLAAALLRLKAEPETRRRLAEAALQLAPGYTWAVRAAKLERALDAALES
jgi:glycosyltransferase involved in cell wall biosynthesis